MVRQPLPSKQKYRPKIPDGLRIYAVGDIHGRADLLTQMLTRIDEDMATSEPVQTIQVFLGDYVDRGPNSREVLDLLIARGRTHRTVCLMGNHETYPLQFLQRPEILNDWQQLGGLQTLMSYGITPSMSRDSSLHEKLALEFQRALPQSHRQFLAGLKHSYTCEDFFFVHAGVRPGIPLAKQRPEDMLWIREDFLLHEEDFGKIIVHGHTPILEPEIRPNRINIDTGAYATGRLTCLVIERDEMFLL